MLVWEEGSGMPWPPGVVSLKGRGCWPRVPRAGVEAGQGEAVAA